MRNEKILLPSKKYKKATSQDLSLNVNLNSEQSLLRHDDRDIVIDLLDQFKRERNNSENYKIFGKIKMIFKNLYSGTTNYTPLKNTLYLNGNGLNNNFNGYLPYNEFSFIRKDFYKEDFQFNKTNTLGLDIEPIKTYKGNNNHIIFTSNQANSFNWNFYLTYPYDIDENFEQTYTLSGDTKVSFTVKDGIPFRVLDNGNYYKLTSPIKHGFNNNEYIIISGGTYNGINQKENCLQINNLGDENYDSENYVLNISKSQVNGSLPTLILGKRCLDINNIINTTSKYYVYKLKTLTNINDCTIDNLGFENNIFRNEKKIISETYDNDKNILIEKNKSEVIFFDFKNPILLKSLKNNLGVSINKLYLSIVFKNSNGYFNYPPKIGFKYNFHDKWVDKHFENDTSIETNLNFNTYTNLGFDFLCGNELNLGSTLIGDFIEYNKKELMEKTLSPAFHKIESNINIFNHNQNNQNLYSGVTNNNMVGLFYQPHYEIKIKELSPNVEVTKTKDIFNLPELAYYDQVDKTWRWRDIYEHGYIDDENLGTNYPFFNGLHYIKKDINFYLRNEFEYINKKVDIKKNIDTIC